MKKPKTNIIKLKMIKPLYRKFRSANYVAKRLELDHTTILYWLGRLKNKKPKRNIKEIEILPEDYITLLKKTSADDDPIKVGRELRDNFKHNFGVFPEEYEKSNINRKKTN